MRRTVEAIDPVTGTLNIVIAKQYSAVCVRCVAQHENFLRSICHDVLGLYYLDGMSKSAADGDTVAVRGGGSSGASRKTRSQDNRWGRLEGVKPPGWAGEDFRGADPPASYPAT